MSLIATSTQSAYPDEFSDSMATLTASILQEQLAPILETLREHAKLLDLHAALLNHSTVMNRYNVGKLDDARDLQVALNYKLQFYIDPENRQHPEYRRPIPLEPLPTTEPLPNVESRMQDSGPVPSSSSDEPTQSPAVASAAATAAASTSASVRAPPDPLSTLATTEPAAQSHPANPRQAPGDGSNVVPGPTRRPLQRERPFSVPDPRQVQLAVVPAPSRRPLQRERPFSEAPDPMANTWREINIHQPLPAPPPPPPYVNPPAYTPEDATAPRVATPAAPVALSARSASPSSESTSSSSSSESEVEQATLMSSRAAGKRRRTADNARGGSPSTSAHSSAASAAGGGSPAASENEDDGDEPETGLSSQLSERARGKKRMRDEDGEVDGPSAAGGSSGQASREGSAHKRMKGKEVWEDTWCDTGKLELHPAPVMLARMGIVEKPTQDQRRYGAEKMRLMEKLFAGSRDSL